MEAPVGDRGCLGPSVSVVVVWVEVRGEGAGEGAPGAANQRKENRGEVVLT